MAEIIEINNMYLRTIDDTLENRNFINELFIDPDVKKYYTLRDDHAHNINSFVSFMADKQENGRGFYFIIEQREHIPVGLITAEPIQDNFSQLMWNVGFAILPSYRRKGYAYQAVCGLSGILYRFKIDTIMLDISEFNTASESLAKKCGFEVMESPYGGKMRFIDPEHEELGARSRWTKKVHETGNRDKLCENAVLSYRNKNFSQAIEFFKAALREPMSPGSPSSDGLICANIGMAYYSIRDYNEAYRYYKKAYEMGIRNASIIDKLKWLENNFNLL